MRKGFYHCKEVVFYRLQRRREKQSEVCFMKSTEELMGLLQNLDIEEFKKSDSFSGISTAAYLNELLKDHSLTAKDIIIRLNMERSYTYQLLKGRRQPTRNFIIRIAILCQLSVDETQKLLTIGRRPILYPRNRFDAAVLYCLQHQLKEEELNELLNDIGENSLC